VSDAILALVVITAFGFDFTNGFHDTGNAMATSIATGALPPKVAVALSGALNLVGAFLSLSVAATIASGLVDTKLVTLTVVFAGLVGGITWNLLTWFFGIPSSSSHALIGGVVGSTIAAAGSHGVKWHGLVSKVIIPAGLSPIIAIVVSAIGTYLVYFFKPRRRQAARPLDRDRLFGPEVVAIRRDSRPVEGENGDHAIWPARGQTHVLAGLFDDLAEQVRHVGLPPPRAFGGGAPADREFMSG
jgi:phosphate/sulfate permease